MRSLLYNRIGDRARVRAPPRHDVDAMSDEKIDAYWFAGYEITPRADLREVKLREANLSGAINAVCLGYDQRGYRFVGIRHDGGWCISAGCRWFTMPQAIEHWTDKGNKDALARVAILQAH